MQIPDSTQSRDHEEDYINLPVTDVLTIDTYITVRPQTVLFQQNSFDNFNCVFTYIVDIIYAAQNFHNPPVTVSLQAYDTPIVYGDQQLQEFLNGEECCHNFINRTYNFSNHLLFTIQQMQRKTNL